MKKHNLLYLMAGILIGALTFGGFSAMAAAINATYSNQPIIVNGKSSQVTAYNIDGSNYLKLRDMAAAIDMGVWWNEGTNTIYIETNRKYDPNYTGPNPTAATQSTNKNTPTTYNISDYYNSSGKFSDFGLALTYDEKNSESQLKVKRGDFFIVGKHKYEVTAESLTVFFYTQPSLDQVTEWWIHYFESAIKSGKVVEVS